MKRNRIIIVSILLAIILTILMYRSYTSIPRNTNASPSQRQPDTSGKKVLYWYDPMVPNQKFDKPGKSPFMDMQLVPKYENEPGEDSGVNIPSQTQQNLGIRLEAVARTSFVNALTTVGRIEPDERRFFSIQTRIPGFVERLYVRAVGEPVAKGQRVAEMYAPELLSAQQEYLAMLDLKQIDASDSLIEASRNRLKLLGMSTGEISGITKSRKALPHIGIYSPNSGVVTELGVREGGQLMPGGLLMQVSDLSKVWMIAEVSERDANRIVLGSTAEVTMQIASGNSLNGKVSYLYPTLDESTRTLRVRIDLDNPKGSFRPGMYANATFSSMGREVLAVPSESIIATGKRNVVIVRTDHGFRPVEVTTGLESDGKTEILSGLAEGEKVVVSGQFFIDSEASLSGVLARLSQQDMVTKPIKTTMGDMEMKSTLQTPTLPQGKGKVVRIDIKTGEVTLDHDPIPELNWPAMTMGFKVKNVEQLRTLTTGDQVHFGVQQDKVSGDYLLDQVTVIPSMKKDGKP